MLELEITSDVESAKENVMYYLKMCFPEKYMNLHGMTPMGIIEKILEDIKKEGE